MARVTVEDCIDKVANRFKLVLMAAKRARDLERGAKPSVVRDNDKSTILALREIAEEAISIDGLENLTKQNIINDEAELPYESDEVQLRSDNDSNEEYEDIDDEDFEGETEEDDDWETSDNPYNRRLAVNNDDSLDDPAFSEEESEYDPSDDKSDDEDDDEDEEIDEGYENEDDEYFDDEFEDDELDGDDDQEDEE